MLCVPQLDGETDWKLRKALPCTQRLNSDAELLDCVTELFAEAPKKDIYEFAGTFTMEGGDRASIDLDNTLWANCVLATSQVRARLRHRSVRRGG